MSSIRTLLREGALPGLLRSMDTKGRMPLAFMPIAPKDSWLGQQFPKRHEAWDLNILARTAAFELRGELGGPNLLISLALHLPDLAERLKFRDVETTWDREGQVTKVRCTFQASSMLGLTTEPVDQALKQFGSFVRWLAAVHRQHAPTAPNAEGHWVAGPELGVLWEREGPVLTWHKGKALTAEQRSRLNAELATWLKDPHIAGWVETMKEGAQIARNAHVVAMRATDLFTEDALSPHAPVPLTATLVQRVGDHWRRRRRP